MNGAKAEPAVMTIKMLISKSMVIKGMSQYFFLVLRKPQNSFNISILFLHIINHLTR